MEKIISQKGQDVNAETMRILEDAIKLLESKEPQVKDNLFAKKLLEDDLHKKV